MASYDADLQAAVDATSVARDAGIAAEADLVGYLRQQLAEREVETADEAWLQRTVEAIIGDPNYMIETEPSDFVSQRKQQDG
ncbi:hypothetical protein [Nocardioides sp. 1609]|uniref:hypothetical protein n=1 Tax=Nocardioides sp. 1609 TaxID=2508327 RepID=UPI001070370B|nr:hypothetical protein [Nocardioides sp. 1609]